MLELFLIRHAEAVSPSPGVADFDRTLSPHGEQDAVRMGRRLAELGLGVDCMISSPAHRARETARLVAAEVGFPAHNIRYIDAFYNASADVLLAEVQRTTPTCRHLALVGHNPGISWLRQMLTGDSLDMPAGAVTVIHFDVDDWQVVHSDTGWVAHYAYPAGLPDSGA
ncbi:phosphohistidine phosphatase [Thiogranum longum]|uniref:Phosphohistidine phosphatase n=1 Tax=Thiogranum longum TaxID=1537524 RepID=A0A4V2PGP7_9GAMM|nr:histidine phosphatase family protein [Thiogranum longum]TCK17626.1 phosphohistidine phosphatase [Thiogranum longum]